MSRIGERRVRVELAMIREGEALNMSGLARELGVSRWTVRRDAQAVRARWATLAALDAEGLDAERASTAAFYEVIAREAMAQYERLAGEAPAAGAAIGYLRTALEAMEKRARLLGLEGGAAARDDDEGVLRVVYVDELTGREFDRPPSFYDEQGRRIGVEVDEDGNPLPGAPPPANGGAQRSQTSWWE